MFEVVYMRTFHSAYITCGTLHLHAYNLPTCDSRQPLRHDRLHYNWMPLTCWPLQVLAEARTFARGQSVVGRSTCMTPLTLAKKARTCAVVSAPFIYAFTFAFTFTFTFTITFTFTSLLTFKFVYIYFLRTSTC